MDAAILVNQASSGGIPAPFWFVEFFKVLGFTLHMAPMHLWYAGLLVALCLHLRGNQHARRSAARLLQQMPVIVAVGVNLGIVPLLFVQLAYFRVFYPATILMAWFWLAIVGLLIPAYYGVYAYAGQFREGTDGTAGWRVAAGWCAAILFVAVGFLFANGWSLMEHVGRWGDLWTAHSIAGAATGTALNVGDATLWPRWLLMFGLALGTTSVWLLVDVFWLNGEAADEAYRRWAMGFAKKLSTFGMVWAAAAGTWYVFGTWSSDLRAAMFGWPLLPLTVATAIAPGLPWVLMMTADRLGAGRGIVAAIALCQFGVLGINATSRQVVQNVNLKPFLDVSMQPLDVQWSPLVVFLAVFVMGLALVGWMIGQIIRCKKADSV
jgi:hypothetical protein